MWVAAAGCKPAVGVLVEQRQRLRAPLLLELRFDAALAGMGRRACVAFVNMYRPTGSLPFERNLIA